MKKQKLKMHYDPEGDCLEVTLGDLTPSYYEDLGKDTFKRVDEATGEVKGFVFFNVQRQKDKLKDVEMEIPLAGSK